MHVKSSSTLPKNSPSVADLSELSTPELVGLAQAGELEAFDPLYRRYAGEVLAYARGRLRVFYDQRVGADEVAARTWAAALEAIGRYQPRADGDPFRAWLFRIARYESRRFLDKTYVELPAGGTCDEDTQVWLDRPTQALATEPASNNRDNHADKGKTRMAAQLREAIGTLTADQQTLVRMRLDGMDLCDIARATGRSYRRVCQLWDYAQASLRSRLHNDQELFADRVAVRRAVMALSPTQQQVALLRLDGMRECDVVQATGLSKKAVCNAWSNARNNLRRHLTGTVNPKRSTPTQVDCDRLRQVAASMPAPQRQVVLLRLDGMRQGDVVRATGQSLAQVRSAWRRARAAGARQGLAVA